MDEQYTKFVDTLHNLVKDLNRYYPNQGCQAFLDNYKNLDLGKIMLRFLTMIRQYETKLTNRDETLFSNDLSLFPGINVTSIWTMLKEGQKKKVWTYLQILYYQSELLLNTEECTNETSTKHQILQNIKQDVTQSSFNPYEGIGQNKTDYSVEDMFPEKMDLEELKNFKPGLGSVASALGIDKALDLEKLREQLKNMTKEDIDNATSQLKNVLGANAVNQKTAKMIEDMLSGISEELQNDNMSDNTNAIDKIMKIAESVANRMQPKMQNEQIDIRDLWNSTQNVAKEFKDEKGNPIFADGNPLANIGQYLSGMGNMPPSTKQQNAYLQQASQMMGGTNMNLTPEQQQQMMMMMNGMLSNTSGQTNSSRKKRK